MKEADGDPSTGRPPGAHPAGALSAQDLQRLVDCGRVTRSDGVLRLGQDSVKLHTSTTLWRVDGAMQRRVILGEEDECILRPGEMVTAVSAERVDIPLDLSGVIFPRGRLLALGLMMPATHVDPGYAGRFRHIIVNVSNYIVRLPPDTEVARLVLFSATRAAERPYHGVNAELESVNPRAEDLIVSLTDADADPDTVTHRLLDLETRLGAFQEQQRVRRQWVARGLTVALPIAAVACAVLLIGLIAPEILGQIGVEIVAAAVVGLLAIVGALARNKLIECRDRYVGAPDQPALTTDET